MLRKATVAFACAAVLITAPQLKADSPDAPEFFRIVSTSPGGLWHTFGTRLTDRLERAFPDTSFSHRPGGSDQNHRMVSSGQAQLGFSFTPISVQAHTGSGDFDEAWEDARLIGTFYAAFLHPVVRAGIDVDHISDLQGRVVSPGQREWGTTAVVTQILEMFDITEESLAEQGGRMEYLGFGDVQSMMQDRRLDAFMYYASVPSPLLTRLSETPGIQLPAYTQEDVDMILENLEPQGGFSQAQFPADPYPGSEGDFPSPVMWSIFVVSKDVPDDVVYEITRILYEDESLRDFMGGGTSLNIDYAADGLEDSGIPFHPGAQKYLEEHGAL